MRWRDSEIVVPRGTVHFFRSKILWEKTCYERLRIHNYGRAAVDLSFSIEFDADFVDIFELRGTNENVAAAALKRRSSATISFLHTRVWTIAFAGRESFLIRRRVG